MSTPNPLIPQGTFQAQANKGASNVRIAVATIIAIHVVFFGGLLLQGCKPDKRVASGIGADTNTAPAATNLTLPPINSDSLYYSNATHLPTDTVTSVQSNAQPATTTAMDTLVPSGTSGTRDLWKSTNLTTSGTSTLADQTASGGTREYSVARGDTFKKIATANGTTVVALRKANPNVDPSKLKVGMKLQVPIGAMAAPANSGNITPVSTTGVTEATGAAPKDSYTVKAGDTLTKVAKAHGVTVSQLRAANNLKTSGLKVGQKLKIPASSAAGTNETTSVKPHKTSKTSTNSTNSTNTATH